MAAGSPDLHDFTRSLANFLYCSTLGRDGRGSASCGLGYMRISFHNAPGVRTIRLKEGSYRSNRCGWARPFPQTGCAPRADPSIGRKTPTSDPLSKSGIVRRTPATGRAWMSDAFFEKVFGDSKPG